MSLTAATLVTGLPQLQLGGAQAALNLLLAVLPALPHALGHAPRIDHQEHRGERVPERRILAGDAAEAFHALNVDVEHEVPAFLQRCDDARLERAVEAVLAVSVYLGPFKELTRRETSAELVRGEKMVMDAVDLARPRRTRRGGHDARESGSLPQ